MPRRAVLLFAFLLFVPVAQAAAPAGWQSYHDARGFTVSFPPDWTADPKYSDQDYPASEEPPPHFGGLALKPKGDLAPGTTLSSVQVVVLPLPPGRDTCVAQNFIAYPPPDYGTSADESTADYAKLTGGDPGGWYTNEDYVWRISTKPCIGVHYEISFYADNSDQAKDTKKFDKAKLLKLLDQIRATVVVDK